MHASVDSMEIEVQQGALVTRYAEWGEMAEFLEIGPVEQMRHFHRHVTGSDWGSWASAG